MSTYRTNRPSIDYFAPTHLNGLRCRRLATRSAIAYATLQRTLCRVNGADTAFARAVEVDLKGKVSLALYVCSVGFAFLVPEVADALYVGFAIIWLVLDRRFEPVITTRRSAASSLDTGFARERRSSGKSPAEPGAA